MKPVIRRQFRVKRGCQQMTLLRRDDAPIGETGEHLCIALNRFDQWRTNENRVIELPARINLFQRWNIQIDLEAVHLASKSIALHGDIHQTDEGLVAMDILRKENRPGAGTPNGPPLPELAQWFDQLISGRQLPHRGGFTTWDNQPIEVLQMLRQAHFDRIHAESLQYHDMFGKVAL